MSTLSKCRWHSVFVSELIYCRTGQYSSSATFFCCLSTRFFVCCSFLALFFANGSLSITQPHNAWHCYLLSNMNIRPTLQCAFCCCQCKELVPCFVVSLSAQCSQCLSYNRVWYFPVCGLLPDWAGAGYSSSHTTARYGISLQVFGL